jgi:predicted secreted Zn-dependent protease
MYAANRPTSLIDTDGREVKESKQVTPFPVEGKTYQEAFQNAQSYVESHTSLTNSQAWTNVQQEIKPSVQVEVTPGNNFVPTEVSEEVSSVTVKLDVTENIPQWTEYNSASTEDKASWDTLIGDIKPHEEGHAEIAEKGAQAIDKALPGTRGIGVGSTTSAAAKQATARLNAAVKKKEQAQAAKTQSEQNAWDDKAKKEHDAQAK